MIRFPRSQRGMPIAPLPLPRSRGDIESTDKARTFAWRAVSAFVALYVAVLVGIVWMAMS